MSIFEGGEAVGRFEASVHPEDVWLCEMFPFEPVLGTR